MTTVPRNSPKKNNTKTYSLWEWTRAYLVLALWLPFFPLLMLLDGRTLPKWLTWKLLRHHVHYTLYGRPMDFRIPPDTRVPAYMERWWRIPRNWATNIYFHVVRRSDDDRALHDHPWWSFSIVLEGGYWEETILPGGVHKREWFGPGRMKFRTSGKYAHRLELATEHVPARPAALQYAETMRGETLELYTMGGADKPKPAYDVELPARTIFVTGPVLRRWGFHARDRWVDAYEWDAYCEANGITSSMRMDGGSDAAQSARNKHSLND